MNKRQQDFIKRELVDRDVIILVLSDGRKRRLQRSGFCRWSDRGAVKDFAKNPHQRRSCWLPGNILDVPSLVAGHDLSYALTRMSDYDKMEGLDLVGVYSLSGRLIKRFK